MNLRKIQRKVGSKMNVNVNITRCRRVEKMVKNKLAGNFVEEFAMLWDYADELRQKNLRSTIKMAVNRVIPESPPHFKPILGLDGCFLKGPSKGEMLSTCERDGNNQMYPIA
ncbi:hypothetical protein Godav_000744 [Gossypium davidsonii]|uniref:Uncharacterized protein n=1 Tax=Gossypium davidsonii TaxID=34287 RepID=A0A7J8T2C7_GOSDV|nr:hypothetical protein [Gossypium davidsonii]